VSFFLVGDLRRREYPAIRSLWESIDAGHAFVPALLGLQFLHRQKLIELLSQGTFAQCVDQWRHLRVVIPLISRVLPQVCPITLFDVRIVILVIGSRPRNQHQPLSHLKILHQVMVQEPPPLSESTPRNAKGRLPSKSLICSKVQWLPPFSSALCSVQSVRISTPSSIQGPAV